MHSSATDVLFFKWLVPQRRVRLVVSQERRVYRHPVIDLMGQSVDDVVVALVNIKL